MIIRSYFTWKSPVFVSFAENETAGIFGSFSMGISGNGFVGIIYRDSQSNEPLCCTLLDCFFACCY